MHKKSTNEKTLILDVDEVSRRIIPVIQEIYEEQHGMYVNEEKITQWSLPLSFPEIKDNEGFFRKNAERIFLGAQPEENAIEVINDLYERHKIVIASSQFKGLEHFTNAWLQKHKMNYDEIHFLFDKSSVKGDLIIDDGIHNLVGSQAKIRVCMDRPWNREYEGYRVSSFQEFHDFVSKLENKKPLFKYFVSSYQTTK